MTQAQNSAPRWTRRHLLRTAAASAAALTPGSQLLHAAALAGPAPAPKDDLCFLPLTEAAERIRAGSLTSTALVTALLDRIAALQPMVNAYITVLRDSALQQAAALDREAAANKFRGPLHGVPIAVKDNIDTAGTRTSSGSAVFDDRVPTADAFVVAQLRRAGAIVLGKTNLHEFAMGGSSATSYFGPVRNPWALDRTPSGSSGGSAAAVAAGMATAALGTDTGGSIRMPAAYCNLVGLKPSYGLVSLGGIFPLIYSMDHCGPLTRTVEDSALLLNSMTGYDRDDVASLPAGDPAAPQDYLAASRQPVQNLRLGIPRAPFFDRVDPETLAAVEQAITVLRGLVATVIDVSLPSFNNVPWTIVRSGEVEAEHRKLFQQNGGLYSLQTHRVVENTAKELNDSAESSANRVADYVEARWVLEHARRTIDDSFSGFDLVAMPTMRVQPHTVQFELDREEDPRPTEPEIESNAIAFDIWGIPAISVPCGFSKSGLPLGLQIAGPRFSEGRVLALARAYQHATSWHRARPNLSATTILPSVHRR